MISFPNAKINIGLDVVGRRQDGYHLLETFFYPIPLTDILEVHVRNGQSTDSLTLYGTSDLGKPEDNLVMRAVKALRLQANVPPLDIYLSKHIPSGAGMGGGSADASFMLLMLNEELNLKLSREELADIALSLGADCPCFIYNQPALGEGVGEKLSPLPNINLEGLHIVVVKPNIHISTAEAFAGLQHVAPKSTPLKERLALPIEQWQGCIVNDFEESLFPLYPQLRFVKDWLYRQGAVYASLTGSGAALYGLFREEVWINMDELQNHFVWQSKL